MYFYSPVFFFFFSSFASCSSHFSLCLCSHSPPRSPTRAAWSNLVVSKAFFVFQPQHFECLSFFFFFFLFFSSIDYHIRVLHDRLRVPALGGLSSRRLSSCHSPKQSNKAACQTEWLGRFVFFVVFFFGCFLWASTSSKTAELFSWQSCLAWLCVVDFHDCPWILWQDIEIWVV